MRYDELERSDDMNNQDFGKFISTLRKEKGLTQKELAERLNLTDKAISCWENGKNYPDIEMFEEISKELDVSISELIACKKIETKEEAISITERAYIDELINGRKKKKRYKTVLILSILIAALCLAFISVEHFYGDDMYAKIFFAESEIVQVNENVFRVPKDNPEVFTEYMCNHNWIYVTQRGNTKIFEQDNTKAYCSLEFKELYAVYKIKYGDSTRTIEELLEACPEYFLASFPEVYVWQMAEDSYYCGALPTTDRNKTNEELMNLTKNPVSVEEMKRILSYCGFSLEEYNVYPIVQPISSYYYIIDDDYAEKIESMFK